MRVEQVTEDHISELSEWFKSIVWDLPPVDGALSKYGFVAIDGKELVSCAWLYTTGSSTAFIQWTATNMHVNPELQSQATSALITYIQEFCGRILPKIRTLTNYTKNERFAQKLKHLDFKIDFGYFRSTWVLKDKSEQSNGASNSSG